MRLSLQFNLSKAMKKWGDASTLILTTPKSNLPHGRHKDLDFEVLMLKRHARNTFYPNAYVFPGGKVDQTDLSLEWMSLFKSVDKGFIKSFEKLKVQQFDGYRSPIFLHSSEDTLLREVAYRICAIRETFEETGILLARHSSDSLNLSTLTSDPYEFSNVDDVSMWRKRVYNKPSEFLNLFTTLRCVPDIWALYEWSNWLTPSETFLKLRKRFDTIFFVASLSNIPAHAQPDQAETTSMTVSTPSQILEEFVAKKIQLGPPQIYELYRMLSFNNYAEFTRFTSERALKGMERWLPVHAKTTDDSFVSFLPGDQWYPEAARTAGSYSMFNIPMTYDELVNVEPRCHNHVYFQHGGSTCTLVVTCSPKYGHVNPVTNNFNQNL